MSTGRADILDACRRHCHTGAAHCSWVLCTVENKKLVLKTNGTGVDALRNLLPDDGCAYCLITLRLELQGVADQVRNVFINWKGPKSSGMRRVQANQLMQEALDSLAPNHGQLEVVGKTNFNEANIALKWQPSSGSHVID
ncbi:hypothetical protein Pelo_11105 [Pelomyxa schiedti]|nr:hypothetical protein Pelo_11105 [Pelomyxa schiedti]